MKKYLLWLPVIFLICSSAINNLNKNVKQLTVNKNISFIVYKSSNYKSSAYDNAYAQLKITVEKVSGTDRTLVLNKIFETKLLRTYSALDNATIQTITVSNVN